MTSDKLSRKVTFFRNPDRDSKEAFTLPEGAKVFNVEFVNVIDEDLSEIEVMKVPDCENPGEKPPTTKAYYLYYGEEGIHHVWMDGGFTDVRDDCIIFGRVGHAATPTSWAKVTIKGGRQGYTDEIAAFELAGDDREAACLFGERRRVY